MEEKYCPVCGFVHSEFVDVCCYCERELIEREFSDNDKDKTCPICVHADKIEMA